MNARLLAIAVGLAALLPSPAALSDAPAASAKPPDRRPDPVPLASLTLPHEKSDRPSADEWKKSGTPVELTRQGYRTRRCRAAVVREWLAIHCEMDVAGIRQYAGNHEDVVTWVRQKLPTGDTERQTGQIIMRLQPGDRRLFEVFDFNWSDYDGTASSARGFMVDETWLEGEAGPTVVME